MIDCHLLDLIHFHFRQILIILKRLCIRACSLPAQRSQVAWCCHLNKCRGESQVRFSTVVMFKYPPATGGNSSRIKISSQSCVNCEGFLLKQPTENSWRVRKLAKLGFSSRNTKKKFRPSSCFSVEQNCRGLWNSWRVHNVSTHHPVSTTGQ